jgi:hypothetical protein
VAVEWAGPGEGEAKLIIPRPLLGRAADLASAGRPRWPRPTFAAAVALAGAGCLGLSWGRGRRRVCRFAFLLAVAGALAAGRAALWANPIPVGAPPPGRVGPVEVGSLVLDEVRLEVPAEGEAVRLVLPRAKAAALGRDLPKR